MKKHSHKVLLCDAISPIATEVFEQQGITVISKPGLSEQGIITALEGISAAVIRSSTTITAKILENAASLKVVGRAGIGVDNIDVNKASECGIIVMNTPFGNTVTTAEHTLAMLMAAARCIPQAAASVKAGQWKRSAFKGLELMDKTLGIVGCGNIGRLVTERALAMKMQVHIYDPFLSEKRIQDMGAAQVSFEELLQQSDFITLHVPLQKSTKNLIDEAAFAKMKPGVIFANCARGGIVDEHALAKNLISGHVRAAACDVFLQEPIQKENPLLSAPNVVLTPHLGAATEEAQERVAKQIAQQISMFLLHGELRNPVNTFSLSAAEHQRLVPYRKLVFKLSRFLANISKSALLSLSIRFWGEARQLPSELLQAESIYGFLSNSQSNVNIINALSIAKSRGVKTEIIKNDETSEFHNLIEINLTTEQGSHEISGTIFAGHARIVSLQKHDIQGEIGPYNLYVMNKDEPGFIEDLAGKLAKHGINIASFHLTRITRESTDEKEAVALLRLDSPVTTALLKELQALDKILDVTYIPFES